MSTLNQIHKWSLAHHPRWLVVLRAALGVFLFIKGISFMVNEAVLERVLQGTSFSERSAVVAIIVTWAHLLGGFLIIIGLLTRWAVLVQIPIVLGAIFFINMQRETFGAGSELPFAVVILLLLILFLVEGGGPISLDNWFRHHEA